MSSVSVRSLFSQARGLVSDSEDARFGDIDGLMADTITGLFEQMAQSEIEQRLGVKLYERNVLRRGYRNGYRQRRAQLSFTTVTVRIPRLREEGFVPSFLTRNRRALQVTESWVERAFMCGINRAEIIRLLESTTGCRPSDGLLRVVQKRVDEQVEKFARRQLTERYIYLFLDAAWVKDIVGLKARRICILCAVGVTADGKKEVIGFKREPRECAAGWTRFLTDLLDRGLDPLAVQLVISDEHAGIKAAVEATLGDVRHQYCWAHRCRNIVEAVQKADVAELVRDLRAVYGADHATAARTALRSLTGQWREKYPSVVAELEKDSGNLLAFYDAPALHREYVRTSNPIERTFLELRRSRFGCGAFASREGCDRVVGHTFIRLNQKWEEVDLWRERQRRQERKRQRKQMAAAPNTGDHPTHRVDPQPGARVAPQQSPILLIGR